MRVAVVQRILASSKLGFQPVHFAAYLGRIDLIRELVKHGCDLNVVSDRGLTPLDAARIGGDVATVAFLIKRGARMSPNGLNYEIKLAYSDWLRAQAPIYVKYIERLIFEKRLEAIGSRAQPPMPSIPKNSGKLYPATASDPNDDSWLAAHKDEIDAYRDRILREVREEFIRKQIA